MSAATRPSEGGPRPPPGSWSRSDRRVVQWRWLPRLLAFAGLALALLAGRDALQLARIGRENRAIASADPERIAREAPDRAFALAWARAAQGDTAFALRGYKALALAGAAAERRDAFYNSGNLFLREALALQGDDAPIRRMPLLELAKKSYRDALRLDPGFWDAKYNLERALRLAPEIEGEAAEDLEPPPPRERAMTTMRGFTLGLP